MLMFITALCVAHEIVSKTVPEHNIMVGYQYRSMVSEERYTSPHSSVLQYSVSFPLNSQKTIGSFVEPSISILGLNQSIAQPVASMTVGFQFGQYFRFGTGPIIAFRPAQEPPFFPQLLIESTFLLSVDDVNLPIKISYVPESQGLEQYQVLIGYSFIFRPHP